MAVENEFRVPLNPPERNLFAVAFRLSEIMSKAASVKEIPLAAPGDEDENIKAISGAIAYKELKDLGDIFNGDPDEGKHRLDREPALKLLMDPLSSETRSTRRNLLFTSAFGLLVVSTDQPPRRIPGLDLDLSGHGGLLLWLLLGLVAYQLVTFAMYAVGDSRRRAVLVREARTILSDVRHAVDAIERGRPMLAMYPEDGFAAEMRIKLDAWLAFARLELSSFSVDREAGRLRGVWDLYLPLVAGGVAAVLLTWRALG